MAFKIGWHYRQTAFGIKDYGMLPHLSHARLRVFPYLRTHNRAHRRPAFWLVESFVTYSSALSCVSKPQKPQIPHCLLYLDKRIVLQILNGRVSEELNWVIGWYQDSLSLNKYPVSKRIVLTCYNLCHMRLIRWYCLGACKAENCVFWCVFW